MLSLSPSFEAAEPCPNRAKLVEAGALFKQYFEARGVEIDPVITYETAKNYAVLLIKPAGNTEFAELAGAFAELSEHRCDIHNTALGDVAVAIEEDGPKQGFLMMAGMMIVQDLARCLPSQQEEAPAHAPALATLTL